MDKIAFTEAVRTILVRNTEVAWEVKTLTRNAKGHITGYELAFVVAGEGVKSPFRRNYLKKKLAKLNVAGAKIEVRRTERKSGVTVVAITFSTEVVAPVVAPVALEAAVPVPVQTVEMA